MYDLRSSLATAGKVPLKRMMFLLTNLLHARHFKSKIMCSRLLSINEHQLMRRSSYSIGAFNKFRPVCFMWSIPDFGRQRFSVNSNNVTNKSKKYKMLGLVAICLTASGIAAFCLLRKNFDFHVQDFVQLSSLAMKPTRICDNECNATLNPLKLMITDVVCSSPNAPGSEVPGLPTYTAADVSSHDSAKKRIWVCFKCGVYDITDFVSKHPGGDKILMAAGGALEPFWELFAIHKEPKVLALLEEYRIGNLSIEDRGLSIENADSPFAADPRRHPILKPRSVTPFNAEPPPELLIENFITPNELFFVRNHLPVPEVDPDSYTLEISGIGVKPLSLTLEELKTKFTKHTITSTIQCAGNRRSELNEVKEVKGLNWGMAAISNAKWSGAKLIDVLKYAGANIEDPRINHVQFEGLDTDPANVPYGASIPAEKGLDPKSDVILAYEMNGQVLPRDHGYPVRLIAPGIVGARNVKWLGRIVLSEHESDSHWQKNDYKGFSPNISWENVDFSTAPAIQDLPVNSAICKPTPGTTVQSNNGKLSAAGYAWSGGGRKIVRVDVSADGGKTWHTASLEQDSSPLYRCWSWTLWTADLPIPREARGKEVELICKAVDSSYNVQPDTFSPIWNLRGVLGNAWHRIRVKIN